MQIESKSDNGKIYIYLRGELDEFSAREARDRLDEIVNKNKKAKCLVFDFSNMGFMDSTGIGVLLGRYKKLKKYGIPTYIQNPNFSINKILQISGIYDIMPKI